MGQRALMIAALTTMTLLPAVCSGAARKEAMKLIATDGAIGDSFGYSVEISGATAIVGAWQADHDADFWGSAYLYNVVTGEQLVKLLPDESASGEVFGRSVALSGTTAIVGSFGAGGPYGWIGSAYLFDTITGNQIVKLVADNGVGGERLGFSVDIDGTIAIAGAPYDDFNGLNSGSAFLFDTVTGQQLSLLLPDDGVSSDRFGHSVAISGTTAIVGAHWDDDNGENSGSVYVFDTESGAQLFKLTPDDGAAGDVFGIEVAISGNVAIVGTLGAGDIGAAYLFDTVTGAQLHKLVPGDGRFHPDFGKSVAIYGTVAAVGAMGDTYNGIAAGSAFLYDTSTGLQLTRLMASDGASYDLLGISMAIYRNTVIVGAASDSENGAFSGSAYLYDTRSLCEADFNSDGSIDTSDLGILIASFWSADVFADLTGDGFVDTADLGMMIGEFGLLCPIHINP